MEMEHQAKAVRNAFWSDIFHNDFQPQPATVTARDRDVEIQYYVESAAYSSPALPDAGALQRYFQRLCCGYVSVEGLGNAYLVTVGNYFRVVYTHESGLLCYEDLLKPAHQKLHTVDGDKVLVYLVVPDVYGCEVSVRERHVQVSLGRDVIARITGDRGWRDSLLYQPLLEKSYIVSVSYVSAGRMSVTYASAKRKCRKWEWELFILQRLVMLLSPFTPSPPADPLPVRDRCLDRCSRVSPGNVPACSDRQSDVVVRMDKMHFSIVNKESFFQKMRGAYPGVDFVCDPDQLTLKLSAERGLGEKVAKDIWGHMRKVRREDIYLTDMQAIMMKNTNAQSWFQQSLDDKAVDCFWELSESPTHSSEHRGPVISVTASESDIPKIAQALQSCFPTKRVFLSKSQVPHLHSDEWKQIQDDLQRLYGKRVVPVLKVEQNKITICDTESNMETTLRAVLGFFHERLVGSQQEFCQEVTEIITKLRPWQVRLLTKGKEKKQLPQCLQQTMSVIMDFQVVRIQAPVHMIDRCLSVFWDHVTDLSQQTFALKTASAQRLQAPDTQQHIQGLLDAENIVCDWQVEQGQLLISAHQSHLSQASSIFRLEIESTDMAFEPQIRQQDNKSKQTEDTTGKETADMHQQTEERSQRNREQQTVIIQKKNKQTQALVKTKPKTVQTEEENVTVTASQTHTDSRHQHDREPPVTQTRETQTELCFQHMEKMLVNDYDAIANNKENTAQARDLASTTPVQSTAEEGQTAQMHATWKSQQSELEGRESDDDDKYEDAQAGSSPPSSLQPVEQGAQELMEPSSDPQDNLHSSEELAFGPQIRQQDNKSKQTEDTTGKETADMHRQTQERSQWNREQQTGTIQGTVQTEEENVTVTASQTHTDGRHQHDREPPVTQTQETQTELCFQHMEKMLLNDHDAIANNKENTDQARDLASTTPVQSTAEEGQTAQMQATWKSQQSELEGRESDDDDKYKDAQAGSSPPSSLQPVEQGAQELMEPSSDPQDNLHSSEGESEQCDPEQVQEEIPFMESPESMDSSQENRGGSRMESPFPWPCEHFTELTQALQRIGDCLTSLVSHLTAHPHIPTGRFADETARKRGFYDVTTESPDLRDTATLSAPSNDTLFSSDQSLDMTGDRHITKEAISYPETDGLNRISDHEYNLSARPRSRIPIKMHASDSEGSSELLSMNSMNSSVSASSRTKEEEGINRQLSSDSSSRAFSDESPAELQEAQGSCYAHPQQPGCPRQPETAGLSQLHIYTPGLLRDGTESGVVNGSEGQHRAHLTGYCPPERDFGNPDRHHFSAVHHATSNETALYLHNNGSSTERCSNPQPTLRGSSEQQKHSAQAEETREKRTSFSSMRAEHQHHLGSFLPACDMTSSPTATSSSGNEVGGSRRRHGSSSKNTPKGQQFQGNFATQARLTKLERKVSQMGGVRAQHSLTHLVESFMITVQRQQCEIMQMLSDIRRETL